MSEITVEKKGWLTDLVPEPSVAQNARLIVRDENLICVTVENDDVLVLAAPGNVTGFIGNGGETRPWSSAVTEVAIPYHQFSVHPNIPLHGMGKYIRLLDLKDVRDLRRSLKEFGIMSLIITQDRACRDQVPDATWMVRFYRQYAAWMQADEEACTDQMDDEGKIVKNGHSGLIAGYAVHECACVFGIPSKRKK